MTGFFERTTFRAIPLKVALALETVSIFTGVVISVTGKWSSKEARLRAAHRGESPGFQKSQVATRPLWSYKHHALSPTRLNQTRPRFPVSRSQVP